MIKVVTQKYSGGSEMSKDPIGPLNDSKMLELLKEMNEVREKIKNAVSEESAKSLQRLLNELQLHYDILSERKMRN